MAKLFISKRVFFPPGKQRIFLLEAKSKIGVPWTTLARLLKINNRTLTDWKREKFSMALRAVEIICKNANINMPGNIEIKNPYWYVSKGARTGGIAVYKKYGCIGGNQEYRKKKWYEWWNKKGKYKRHPLINVCHPIKKPKKSTILAEFIGIMMGDGGMTKSQLTITQHHKNDKGYSDFIIELIKQLFNVSPNIHHRSKYSINNISVSRTELVRFCVSLGLPVGNKVKQQIDIPNWIKIDKKFLTTCIRGLIDTDGCIFTHSYKVSNKIYSYKKLAFANRSKPLILSVYRFFKNIGLSPRLTNDGKDVRIESKTDIQKYFHVIGSHNPKHLKRFLN